jgi:hypothetical protein
MPFPDDYIAALEQLAMVFTTYREQTGNDAVLVGGAATAIYTGGQFQSGDFDVVAANDHAFKAAMIAHGFRPEDAAGYLLGGFYHPDFPAYGIEQVSGALFDGRSDRKRLVRMTVKPPGVIVLPPIEDMIADRLAQHAIAAPSDDSRLRQARTLFRLARGPDICYLLRRISDEGGDPALLGLDPEQ